MRQLLLSGSLVIASGLFILQLPSSILMTMKDTLMLAAVGDMSMRSYGVKLGIEVDEVVKNIHARINGAKITHADILTIMCMESAGLIGRRDVITSSAGARGMTQVMPGTLAYYARNHAGGFYLPNRPDLLYSDSRYSIEAGALIFNHHLMNYIPRHGELGGRRMAAIAYNGGPGRVRLPKERLPKETRDYAYKKLPHCYNRVKRGESPVDTSIWTVMVAKVVELTGGKMSLGGSAGVMSDIPSLQTPITNTINNPIERAAQEWWGSPAGRQVQQAQQQVPPQRMRQADGVISEQRNPVSRRDNDAVNREQASWIERFIYKRDDQPLESKFKCTRINGKIKLQWSCPSGTTVSRGYTPSGGTFDTHGASAGLINIVSDVMGTYQLMCIQGHKVLAESDCEVTEDNKPSKRWLIIDTK